jgi:phytoene dehydrogenase-like protein
MRKKSKSIVIVGAGMAGLTAAAYLSKEGYKVLLLEKNDNCGGLLTSFNRDGFVFDTGARSIVNAGIVRPMLKQLGIEIEFLESLVTIGIENEIVHFDSLDNVEDYKEMLERLFPQSTNEIEKIFHHTNKIIKDMAILYGIDNPFFVSLKEEKEYVFRTLLPWLGKFMLTLRRISRTTTPIETFLEKLSSNQSLIDMIYQHFFKNTPTFFALGYFYVYMNYIYPKGGTGQLPLNMKERVLEFGGEIQNRTKIIEIDPSEKKITDEKGKNYDYDHLIWCADLKTLYRILKTDNLNKKITTKIKQRQKILESKRGGDSVFSLMIGVDQPLEYFSKISKGHFFYTPLKEGLGDIHKEELNDLIERFEDMSKVDVLTWLDKFCKLNTYEISIPVLRDPSLAPEGKTGLIISLLFEFKLFEKIQNAGWLSEFKKEVETRMISNLDSIYPGMKDKIVLQFSSTPLDIVERVGSSEGGITGWSFEDVVPVVSELTKISKSVITPIPRVLKAGQWSYSPSGVPIAIFTGWHAAQRIIKKKK